MVTPADEQPETMTVDEFLAGAQARLDRVGPRSSHAVQTHRGEGLYTWLGDVLWRWGLSLAWW